MNEAQLVPTLVQAGAVGISFALIYLCYWLIKTIVGNHISHNTDAMIKMVETLTKLDGSIQANTKASTSLIQEVRSKK